MGPYARNAATAKRDAIAIAHAPTDIAALLAALRAARATIGAQEDMISDWMSAHTLATEEASALRCEIIKARAEIAGTREAHDAVVRLRTAAAAYCVATATMRAIAECGESITPEQSARYDAAFDAWQRAEAECGLAKSALTTLALAAKVTP